MINKNDDSFRLNKILNKNTLDQFSQNLAKENQDDSYQMLKNLREKIENIFNNDKPFAKNKLKQKSLKNLTKLIQSQIKDLTSDLENSIMDLSEIEEGKNLNSDEVHNIEKIINHNNDYSENNSIEGNENNTEDQNNDDKIQDKIEDGKNDEDCNLKNEINDDKDHENNQINENLDNQKDCNIEKTKDQEKKEKIPSKDLYGEPHKLKIRNQEINLYIGTLASQSNMSLILNHKSLSLLFTLDISKDIEDPKSFSPFVVHFMTKSYAFGKIPNNPTKRENKISERDILISRLIDRSIRPLIDKNFNLSSQLICTLLSYPIPILRSENDEFFDVEFLAVLGSCIAMYLSSVPLTGIPIPCNILLKEKQAIKNKSENPSEIDEKEGETSKEKEIICFPFISESQKNTYMELFLSFNKDSLIMIECEAHQVSNETIIEAIESGRESVKKIEIFLRALGKIYKKQEIEIKKQNSEILNSIEKEFGNEFFNSLHISDKSQRNIEFDNINKKINLFISKNYPELNLEIQELDSIIMMIKRKKMYEKIKSENKRIDGRGLDEIREIEISMNPSFMESSHGSSIFRRGDTKVLASVILGTMYDEQVIEGFDSDKKERFILHYNFLPYATGEAYQLKNTNRREIGHGKLAFKAIKNLLPERKVFPYTFRACSEILSCNGSSSMATICAASVALRDAGVPIIEPVAGIAIGISKDPLKENYELDDIFVLTDLIGDEDHIGNMDFKIAGTKNGITAMQMDVKDFGIKDRKTLEKILNAGKSGYLKILDEMIQNIGSHRIDMKKNAPSIIQIIVEKNCVKSIIGNRGETIKTICDVSGAKIDIDSSSSEFATINIFGPSKKSVDKAEKIINDLILQPEVGKIYDGIIDKITDFGIFVRFLNDKIRGLIHERNCEGDRFDFYNRKKNLKIGDSLRIKVLFISADGKVGLSIVEDAAEIEQKDSPIIQVKTLNAHKIIENLDHHHNQIPSIDSESKEFNDSSDLNNQECETSEESSKTNFETKTEEKIIKKEYFKFI